MSARHTPGPWSLDHSENMINQGRYWNVIMANVENEETGLDGEVIIGEAFTEENAVSEDEAHANARLMASAPDLLGPSARAAELLMIAAELIRDHAADEIAHYDGTDCDGFCLADDCESTAEMLAAAIAKAEGSE